MLHLSHPAPGIEAVLPLGSSAVEGPSQSTGSGLNQETPLKAASDLSKDTQRSSGEPGPEVRPYKLPSSLCLNNNRLPAQDLHISSHPGLQTLPGTGQAPEELEPNVGSTCVLLLP